STSTRPRWNRCWPGWTAWPRRRSSGCPTRGWARSAGPTWCPGPARSWTRRRCWPSAASGWPTTRCPGRCGCGPCCPAIPPARCSSDCSGRNPMTTEPEEAADRPGEPGDPDEPVVLYEERGPVAVVTLNRPRYRNAQNSAMTYALDAALARAVDSDPVRVIVLAGAGQHFCAGHDIGTPGRDVDQSFDRQAVLWWDHVGRAGADGRYAREMEVYLGMCRRWRDMPKPSIAMVQGACIAGGLMLAWVCDLIVASDDAFFANPVVRMGIPGVEYFAH